MARGGGQRRGRMAGGWRDVTRDHDSVLLTFIRHTPGIGFTIDRVRILLDLFDRREQDCCTVNTVTQQRLATVEQKPRF